MAYIAVYGSLRKGQYNHQDSLKYIGTTSIKGFDLYPVGFGSYPAIIPTNEDNALIIDILECTDEDKSWIDRMEIGAGYYIKEVQVELDGQLYPCHIYIYREEYQDSLKRRPRVESGDWVEFKNESKNN